MPTFDGDNLIITLDSGITSVDVINDVYELWKDWMLSSTLNRKYPQAFRSDGGNPLSSIINQGSYIFLNNTVGWRIKPPEEDITIYLTGNLAVEDTALPAFIPTTGAFTAAILGLQPVTQGVTPAMGTQLEHVTFSDVVTLDVINGYSGTGYGPDGSPIGTRSAPSNNVSDTHIIADGRGINIIQIINSMPMSTEDFSDKHIFKGDSPVTVTLTIDSSTNVTNCEFRDCGIQGTLDGGNVLRDCLVYDINYFNGFISGCALTGTIILGGGVSAGLLQCNGNGIINMGASGQSLSVQGHNGNITITNKSGLLDVIEINLSAGTVTLDSSVTAGTIYVRGVGKLIDHSVGALVINELVNGAAIANIHRILELQRSHHVGTGNVFYWDPYNGDDANDGDHINRSVETFAQAQTLAVDNNHDIIICVPGNPNGLTTTTESISITKNYLFLRGPGRDFRIISNLDNEDAIHIAGNGVEVSGMSVATSATNNEWAIHTMGNFTLIKDVWVSDSVNGIHFQGGEYGIADNVKMHHNDGIGLKFSGTCDHVDIIDCHVGSNYLDNVVIDVDASTHEVNFLGSTVIHSSVTGYGINISASTKSVILHESIDVFNNFAGNVNDLSSNTYYAHNHRAEVTAASVWSNIKALTVGKFLGLK